MKQSATCLNCKTEFTYNPYHKNGKYCCCKCNSEHTRKVYITEWLEGKQPGGSEYRLSNHVRHHLLESHNYKCSKCGWGETNPHTGKVPLEVDHIDDNPYNHSPENLQVLCPNCHSLKTLPPSKSKGGRYKNGNHPKFSSNSSVVEQ